MRLSYLVPSRPDKEVVFNPLTLQNARATRRTSTMRTIKLACAMRRGLSSVAHGLQKQELPVLPTLSRGSIDV